MKTVSIGKLVASQHKPIAGVRGGSSTVNTLPTMASTRPGADDALAIPSLQNGKAVAYKPPVPMTSSVQDFAFSGAPHGKNSTSKPKKAPKK